MQINHYSNVTGFLTTRGFKSLRKMTHIEKKLTYVVVITVMVSFLDKSGRKRAVFKPSVGELHISMSVLSAAPHAGPAITEYS